MRLYEIYKTIFPDGKFYIGQHLLPEGVSDHPKYIGSGVLFQKLFKSYCRKDIVKYQLAIVPTLSLANLAEKIYVGIDKHSPDCLNIKAGGAGNSPQTNFLIEIHRESTTRLWQDAEYRQKVAEGVKKHPHGPLSVPIHNKGKIVYNNGKDQIYLRQDEIIPDGCVPGGLPRPDRKFTVTDEFKTKVSLNAMGTTFYRGINKVTNKSFILAGTVAVGKLLGVSPGQAASVLCRGLIPRRGKLFRLFNEWEFIKITKEEYLQEQNE